MKSCVIPPIFSDHLRKRVASQITVTNIPVSHGPTREGDPAILTADAGKFMGVSKWQPKFNLQDMITHAWAWYNR